MDVNRPEVVAEVTACFERYEQALVDNDVEQLDDLFWGDPLVVRFGPQENLYGHAAISAYRNRRPTGDLKRVLGRTVITTFGRDFATTSLEFQRITSGSIGRQSQSWVRTVDGWRIVAAHVSHLPA